MSSQETTLEYRAAEYVGREDMPRRSVKLGPNSVLIVWDDPKVSVLIYEEGWGGTTHPSSISFMPTPTRRAALAAVFGESA